LCDARSDTSLQTSNLCITMPKLSKQHATCCSTIARSGPYRRHRQGDKYCTLNGVWPPTLQQTAPVFPYLTFEQSFTPLKATQSFAITLQAAIVNDTALFNDKTSSSPSPALHPARKPEGGSAATSTMCPHQKTVIPTVPAGASLTP
jgi:hypothetical protein